MYARLRVPAEQRLDRREDGRSGCDHLLLGRLLCVLEREACVRERVRPAAGADLRLGQVAASNDLDRLEPEFLCSRNLIDEQRLGLIEFGGGEAGAGEVHPRRVEGTDRSVPASEGLTCSVSHAESEHALDKPEDAQSVDHGRRGAGSLSQLDRDACMGERVLEPARATADPTHLAMQLSLGRHVTRSLVQG